MHLLSTILLLSVIVLPEHPTQGQLVVIEVRGANPGDRVSGTFQDRKLRFFVDGQGRVRALAAVPLECEPGKVPVEIRVQPAEGDPLVHGTAIEVQAGEFGEQLLRVNPRFVKPPKKYLERIKRERAEIEEIQSAPPTARKWSGSFVWPRKDKICSEFGLRRVFNGELQSRHLGLDIDGRTGSPVRAIGAGRVVMVTNRYYSGGTVVIDHGLRLFSMYFHLSAFSVEKGRRVSKGQLIGKVGRSGRATGPHLHITTKVEDVAFDPLDLFGLSGFDP